MDMEKGCGRVAVKSEHAQFVRKRFPRNPYAVTNIDDAWEMDLADLSSPRNTAVNTNNS
jgi:hypothetical protein